MSSSLLCLTLAIIFSTPVILASSFSPDLQTFELLNVTTTIFGAECTIQSVAYPSQYLVMKSGFFHFYPELSRVTLKPDVGAWDWSGIWKINIVKSNDETYFQLWNHKTELFMAYNVVKSRSVRGMRDDGTLKIDTFWNIIGIGNLEAPEITVTVQHAQHPNGYLYARTSVRKGIFGQRTNNRPVDISFYEPKNDLHHWNIWCGSRKQTPTFIETN